MGVPRQERTGASVGAASATRRGGRSMTIRADAGGPEIRTSLSRRELMRRAAAVGFAVPTLAALTELVASAQDEINFVAMDYDPTMQEDTQNLVDAFNDSQGDVKADLQVVSWD